MNFKYFRTDNNLGRILKEELIKIQNNKCLICEEDFKSSFYSRLDHDHSNGNIRGVICNKCNSLLRNPNDNVNSLNLIKTYITTYNSEDILYYDLKGKLKKEYTNKLLIKQNNCCAICSKDFKEERICLDHNHNNGKVRGLLCVSCNFMLIHTHDNIEILNNAIIYIQNNPLKEILNDLEPIMMKKRESLKIDRIENSKKALKNLETRKKMSIKKKEYFSNQENRDKQGITQTLRFSKPEEKEKSKINGKKAYETRLNNIKNKIL